MTPSLKPSILPSKPSLPTLDLHSALTSTLRAWLVARDTVLFVFVAGTDDSILDAIDLSSPVLHDAVERLNAIRILSWGFAAQLCEKGETPELVIAREMEALLSMERPRFLLSVPSIPGSF